MCLAILNPTNHTLVLAFVLVSTVFRVVIFRPANLPTYAVCYRTGHGATSCRIGGQTRWYNPSILKGQSHRTQTVGQAQSAKGMNKQQGLPHVNAEQGT